MKIKYQILFILSFITVMPAYGQTTDVNSQLIVQLWIRIKKLKYDLSSLHLSIFLLYNNICH